jgi:hypothetical protein
MQDSVPEVADLSDEPDVADASAMSLEPAITAAPAHKG